jgi:hypothetical protein
MLSLFENIQTTPTVSTCTANTSPRCGQTSSKSWELIVRTSPKSRLKESTTANQRARVSSLTDQQRGGGWRRKKPNTPFSLAFLAFSWLSFLLGFGFLLSVSS